MKQPWLVLGVLMACVPNGKLLSKLSAEQATSVCEEYAQRTIVCGDEDAQEVYVFGGDCDSARAPADCEATVGDYRDCQEAVEELSDEDFCSAESDPAACVPLLGEDCVRL